MPDKLGSHGWCCCRCKPEGSRHSRRAATLSNLAPLMLSRLQSRYGLQKDQRMHLCHLFCAQLTACIGFAAIWQIPVGIQASDQMSPSSGRIAQSLSRGSGFQQHQGCPSSHSTSSQDNSCAAFPDCLISSFNQCN